MSLFRGQYLTGKFYMQDDVVSEQVPESMLQPGIGSKQVYWLFKCLKGHKATIHNAPTLLPGERPQKEFWTNDVDAAEDEA